MKKLATLLIAAGMVFAASAPASAVDVKVDGQYWMDFQTGSTFTGDNASYATQRVRLGIAAVASENLSGYFQIHNDEDWGNMTSNHGNTNVRVRCAYIDWTVPGTAAKVRMGRQVLGLPADALGQNLVMHTGFGTHDAIAVSAPVADWASVTAFWTRGYIADAKVSELQAQQTSDAFGIVAKIKAPGVVIEPWAMYADIDKEGEYKANSGAAGWGGALQQGADAILPGAAYWIGATATVNYFDPFKLVVSAAWSEKKLDHDALADRQGWYATIKASYKTSFGTPYLAGWYASGDDKGDYKGQGQINGYGGRCRPLFGAMNGSAGLPADPNASGIGIDGKWGVMAGIDGVSFVKDLSHKLYVAYVEGTNDKSQTSIMSDGTATAKNIAGTWKYMTEEDSFVEFGLANTYKIYKNLSATLELSYTLNDFDTEGTKVTEDAWRSMVTFQYKF